MSKVGLNYTHTGDVLSGFFVWCHESNMQNSEYGILLGCSKRPSRKFACSFLAPHAIKSLVAPITACACAIRLPRSRFGNGGFIYHPNGTCQVYVLSRLAWAAMPFENGSGWPCRRLINRNATIDRDVFDQCSIAIVRFIVALTPTLCIWISVRKVSFLWTYHLAEYNESHQPNRQLLTASVLVG